MVVTFVIDDENAFKRLFPKDYIDECVKRGFYEIKQNVTIKPMKPGLKKPVPGKPRPNQWKEDIIRRVGALSLLGFPMSQAVLGGKSCTPPKSLK